MIKRTFLLLGFLLIAIGYPFALFIGAPLCYIIHGDLRWVVWYMRLVDKDF